MFRETIKDSFSLKKLKQKNLLQMLVLIILSSFLNMKNLGNGLFDFYFF
ncbi:hypothetical protein SMIM3I_00894 [Streptococcus mitis]|uniref:Uncharacterized protein n=1 Tax=Streptococcus mitis TaxID=28037 RepID=A0A150NLB0_STRMT|nr:hypothetical protein SMIM3I_00894 [Streptococcus mitis]